MRRIAVALAISLVASVLVGSVSTPAISTPVATDSISYTGLGRIFPDPHGCLEEGGSPFAKGLACATDFIQYSEMVDGTTFLEETFPDFVKFYTLHEDFNCKGSPVAKAEDGCAAFRSAGVPQTVTDAGEVVKRDRLPMHMVRITDESVPNKGKEWFVFPLSIHGIERAGAEGGTRAAEDLATWAACEAEKAPDYVDCAHEDNAAPHPLLEATPDKSIMAGDALKKSVIYFIWPNPDGWVRGDRANGANFYQRYNGNGVDLNRDWPEQGWTWRPYTPWSEPESKSYGKVLQAIGPKDKTGKPKWTGGIDLHGMLNAPAFSYTLLGGTERPYGKDQRILQTVKGAWRDAEERLAWSELIKPNDAPADDARMYGVQWGTIWDTIDYTVTGAFGNWIDSPMGLNADGIDNEMAFSHLSNCGIGSCFQQDLEQLHIDGNKSLIYSMINYSYKPENKVFETKGRVAYLHNKGFVSEKRSSIAPKPAFTKLPQQEDVDGILLTKQNDYIHEFDVKGPPKFYNGGIEVLLTCTNVQGVGPCSASVGYLEKRGGVEHPGGNEGDWEVVNSYNGGTDPYLQSGQALHANYPSPGRYRIRINNGDASGAFSASIDFRPEAAWPDPGQLSYKVTNMKFWKMLQKFSKPRIAKLTERKMRTTNRWMRRYDTIVITNKVYPKLAKKLRKWVAKKDGNLVLLDKALKMLPRLRLIPPRLDDGPSVTSIGTYAGHVNFRTATKEVTYNDKLARKVNQPGAAEGANHRHQTYEPVPLGYSLEDGGANSPAWYVHDAAWTQARGKERAIGSTLAAENVSFGEIKWKGGRIRILGSLLPMPTKKFDNPFGLGNYALTFTGYQLLQNMVTWVR